MNLLKNPALKIIDKSIEELSVSGDLTEKTVRKYIVAYLLKKTSIFLNEHCEGKLIKSLDNAIQDLIYNQDLEITHSKEHVVNYICQKLRFKH